jgi:voltage-gated potassium channel Kch
VAPDVDRLVFDAVVAAGSRKAIFTRSDLAAEVAARIPADAKVDATTVVDWVERLTARGVALEQTVTLRPERDGPVRASDARYASATTLNQELAILRFADAGRGLGVATCRAPVVADACRRRGLDWIQTAAVARIVLGGDQVSVLVAPAGTGKTTTLAAMVDAWHSTGQLVVALAPSARAAKELAAATGLPADTVAKYLYENTEHPGESRYRLPLGSVVIVDETSMLATVDLHQLKADVELTGGKLLLVGDPAQISPVDAAGGMLPALAERLDAPTLTTVHRLRDQWERDASLQLRAGDPACIAGYLAHGRVHLVEPDVDPYEEILAAYQQLTTDGTRVMLLARSHDDVDQLNTRARQHAIDKGEVRGDPLLTVGGHEWRVGDRLRVTRNDRRIPVGTDYLRNGDVFIVTGHTMQGLDVQRPNSTDTAMLPRDYLVRHARYGWASTIDAAQGATVDHSLLFARPGLDRTRLYVALTRGRESNHTDLGPEPDLEITPRRWQGRPVAFGDPFARMLATAGELAAAHTRLPGAPALLSRTPPVSVAEPVRWPARQQEPYQHDHQRDRPYRGLSR